MKIAVLNGSPKGELSVTVQYIRFIQKKFPGHEFRILNVAHDILRYEKDENRLRQVISEVKSADGVIWAFPLYVFFVSSQYKRFIELIREKGVADAFRDKYTCVLSTSIHFFDHTAHAYMRGICDDLGMKFTESYSADMDDLFMEDRRTMVLKWAEEFLKAIEFGAPSARMYAPVSYNGNDGNVFSYQPGKPKRKIPTGEIRVRVITDIESEMTNLANMVKRFSGALQGDVEVHDLREIDIRGGCLGCLECAFDNICVYKDGFVDFFNRVLRDADVVILAGAIKDRFLSARVKMFWDRRFFNGHVPVHVDKQVGFIISGPLCQLPNLQEILQANAEMSGANLSGVVTDESGESSAIDALIDGLAARCVDFARSRYIRPKTFLGVGGHKIFRDQIWSRLRFPFDADFRFYEAHGMFDFPQNDDRHLEFSKKMIGMIQEPGMREMVRKMIKTEMLKGYQKIVEAK